MTNSKNAKILIFDSGGIEFLEKLIFDGKNQLNVIEGSPKINFFLCLLKPRFTILVLRYFLTGNFPGSFNWKKKIYSSYLCSLVKLSGAKIIVAYKGTFSLFFGVLANNFSNIKFIGIAWAQVHERILRRTVVSDNIRYYVFGQYDVDAYKKIGHEEKNIIPVGGLIGGYYKAQASNSGNEILYDFCIVSQVLDMWFESGEGQIESRLVGRKIFEILMEYFVRYLEENNQKKYKICVALRAQAKNNYARRHEEEFFKSYLCRFDVDYIQNKPLEFSTYKAIDQSAIILTHYSTAAFEAISWKKKILFCQFLDYPKFPIPDDLEWRVTSPGYDYFEDKLITLSQMQKGEYDQTIEPIISKYNNFNQDLPCHELIEKDLKSIVYG